MPRSHALATLACLTLPAAGAAQARPAVPVPAVDTAAVHVATAAVLRELSGALSVALHRPRAARDPWRVTVPDPAAPVWDRVRRGLPALLGARGATAADGRFRFVDIAPLAARADTLIVRFTIGTLWRCGRGRWAESSYAYTAYAVRAGSYWQPAESREVVAADPPPCPEGGAGPPP